MLIEDEPQFQQTIQEQKRNWTDHLHPSPSNPPPPPPPGHPPLGTSLTYTPDCGATVLAIATRRPFHQGRNYRTYRYPTPTPALVSSGTVGITRSPTRCCTVPYRTVPCQPALLQLQTSYSARRKDKAVIRYPNTRSAKYRTGTYVQAAKISLVATSFSASDPSPPTFSHQALTPVCSCESATVSLQLWITVGDRHS